EESPWIAPDRLVEAKRTVVERLTLLQASDVEMDMTHRGPAGRVGPCLAATSGDHASNIQRVGRHLELPFVPPPAVARSVGIDLDAEPIGIPQVQRLAHRMIRH